MGKYKYIIYEKEGAIARVTINRPEVLNAIQYIGPGEDALELWAAMDEAADDPDIKVVILGGAGRAFATGHNMGKVGFLYGFGTGQPGEEKPTQEVRLRMDRAGFIEKGFQKLLYHPKLTIARVQGYAVAGGFELAMFCDFQIVSETAVLSDIGERYGFAGSGHPHLSVLIARVGLTRAVDLMVTGRWISGKQAADMGLVTMAVPEERLEEEATRLAKGLSLYPADGIAIGKATRHALYEQMGFGYGVVIGYLTHTLFTNLKYRPNEWIFFKERREKGVKEAFKEKDRMFGEFIDDYKPPKKT